MSRRIIVNSDGSRDLLSERETETLANAEYLDSRRQIRTGLYLVYYCFSFLLFPKVADIPGAWTTFDKVMKSYFLFLAGILQKLFSLVGSIPISASAQGTVILCVPSIIILWALWRKEPNLIHKIIYRAIPILVFIPYYGWALLRWFR